MVRPERRGAALAVVGGGTTIADNIFDAVGTDISAKGVVDTKPTTDEDWAKVRIGAVTLAEGTNLLKMVRPIAPPGDKNNSGGPNAPELSPEAILKAAQKVNALSMSVRQTESYVQGLLNPEKKKLKGEEKEKQPVDPNVREARDRLQRALGLKVSIEDKNGRGRVIIEYSRLEDFDALLETIAGS